MIHERQNFTRLTMASVTLVAFVALGIFWGTSTSAQTVTKTAHTAATQQPLYSDYRGVRIGMNADEVRTKLGAPVLKTDELDLYVVSDSETAQVAYDASHKVKVVSVDYLGGVGAPDYKLVVGPDVEVKENGGIYKMVRYESLGFWVSYNRSAGTVPVVSVTIQRLM